MLLRTALGPAPHARLQPAGPGPIRNTAWIEGTLSTRPVPRVLVSHPFGVPPPPWSHVPAQPPGARSRTGHLAREVAAHLRLPAPAVAGDDVVPAASSSEPGREPELRAEPQPPSTSRRDGAVSPPQPDAPADGTAQEPDVGPLVSLALVQRAQAGDAEAFAELYDRYVDMVYRYVRFRVGSPVVAEDLTSETFLRALRSIAGFTWQGRDVGAWFVTIARNLVADHYKSSRFRLELTTDDIGGTGVGPVQEGPEDQVLQAVQDTVLLDAVRKLRPDQQECIVLRFLQGLSVAETAAVMERDVGAVKSLQFRAVRTLGRLLPEGFE